jgi:hypothetical protein
MSGELFVFCGGGERKSLKKVEAAPAGVIVDEEAVSAELALDLF